MIKIEHSYWVFISLYVGLTIRPVGGKPAPVSSVGSASTRDLRGPATGWSVSISSFPLQYIWCRDQPLELIGKLMSLYETGVIIEGEICSVQFSITHLAYEHN